MTFIKKSFQRLIEWMLCCPMEDTDQFEVNLNELYTVIMPISLLSIAAGLLLVLIIHYYF